MAPRSVPALLALRSLVAGLVLAALCALGPAAVGQNPLARKAAKADPLVGTFQGDELTLVLEARGRAYAGTATIHGASYPVNARKDGAGGLTGRLVVDGEAYGFTARLAGGKLLLDSEGEHYELSNAAAQASANPLTRGRGPAPEALEGVFDGPVDTLRHPDGYFTAEVPKGWTIAQVAEDAVILNPGLTDTLDCLLVVSYGLLEEAERGVDVVSLFSQGEAELLQGLAAEGVSVRRASQPPRKVNVAGRAGAEQSWSGNSSGTPVTVWCGGLVEGEYYIAVLAVMVQGQQQRFLPGTKRLFRSLQPKVPERNPALERALAGASFFSSDTNDSGTFSSTYAFHADGSVESETMMSGMIGISVDVGADTTDWGTWRTAGPLVYLQFESGQSVARVETDARGQATALLIGEARYSRR